MYYSSNANILSTASLVGMGLEAEMIENDAEFLEQGVLDESCLGGDTPDMTSGKKFEEKSRKQSIGGPSAPFARTAESTFDFGEIDGEVGSHQSMTYCNISNFNFTSSFDEFSMLPESVNVDADQDQRYLSQSSQGYFLLDGSGDDIGSCNDVDAEDEHLHEMEQDLKVHINVERHEDENLRLPQDESPNGPKSQTGCTSSENMTLGKYAQSRGSVQITNRLQSASQPTSEVETGTSSNFHLNKCQISSTLTLAESQSLLCLQVIREGVESRFNNMDKIDHDANANANAKSANTCRSPTKSRPLPYTKSMNRLLIEAAQFAEAVGEIPPSSVNEISRRIIDADEDEEDDDSDMESTETKEIFLKNEHDDDACENDNTLLTLAPATENDNTSKQKVDTESLLDTSIDDSMIPSRNLSDIHIPNVTLKRERSRSLGDLEYLESSANDNDNDNDNSNDNSNYNSLQKNVNKNVSVNVKYVPSPTKFEKHINFSFKRTNFHEKSLLGGLPPTIPPEDEYESQSQSQTGTHNHKNNESSKYVYRGLKSNPPAIIESGLSRGNYAQLHRKAWLEVSDKYHRYGKNLRLYYKHWESLNHPTNMFFDWLDSKGEAAGQPLPNLEECPRSQLDSDTVLYITNPDITARYQLSIEENDNGEMCIVDAEGNPIDTGAEGWIFVLRDSILYAAPKVTSVSGKSKQRFHHSSFFGGKAVAAAGILITNKDGLLQRLYPHSGHYRPGEAHMHRMLFYIQKRGIDLFSFQVDTQQIMHVSRNERKKSTPKGGKRDDSSSAAIISTSTLTSTSTSTSTSKSKKVNNLHLRSGATVACFLAHKAHMIGYGIFTEIHNIRRMNRPISIREIFGNSGDAIAA